MERKAGGWRFPVHILNLQCTCNTIAAISTGNRCSPLCRSRRPLTYRITPDGANLKKSGEFMGKNAISDTPKRPSLSGIRDLGFSTRYVRRYVREGMCRPFIVKSNGCNGLCFSGADSDGKCTTLCHLSTTTRRPFQGEPDR